MLGTALLLAAAAGAAAAGDGPWRGRPLGELLQALRGEGLRLVYSSLLVTPELAIGREPPAGPPERRLAAALAEHGLQAEPRAGGRLVVVRAPQSGGPPGGAPRAGDLVVRDEIVVTPLHTVAANVSREGEAVRGLGADDFRLEVGGREQSVSAVEVVEAPPRPVAAGASGERTADQRLWVLVLDGGGGGLESWQRARRAGEIMASALGANDRVTIVAYSPGGMRTVRKEAAGREEIVSALAAAEAGTVARRTLGRPQRWDPRSAREDRGAPEAVQIGATGVNDTEEYARQATWDAVADDVAGLLAALEALVRDGSGVERRKEVVLASAGFDAALVHGLRGSSRDEIERVEALQRAAERGAIWRLNNDERFGHPAVARGLEETVRALRRAGSPVHVVFTGPPAESSASNGLASLAEQTGGSYWRSLESFTEALPRHLARTSVTYLLRFRLDEKAAHARRRKVRVEVAGLPRGARIEVWPRELPPP